MHPLHPLVSPVSEAFCFPTVRVYMIINYTTSLLTRYLKNRLFEFHKIYSFGARYTVDMSVLFVSICRLSNYL